MPENTKIQTPDEIRTTASAEALHRAVDIETRAAYNAEARTLTLAFASETPVERWYGKEVLSCNPADVDLSRLRNKAPLLMHHDSRFQLGVIEDARIDADKIGRASARLSKRDGVAGTVTDIEDGIITKTSVGYELIEAIEDVSDEDGNRTIKWRWRPLEISLVSVPADDRVGIGRAHGGAKPGVPAEEKTMTDTNKQEKDPAPPVDVKAIAADERKRVQKLMDLGRKHGMEDAAGKAIDDGASVADFNAIVLGEIERRESTKAPAPKNDPSIGLSPKEIRRFSFLKAIRSTIPGEQVDATFERECSAEVSKKLGRSAQGIFVPWDVLARSDVPGVLGVNATNFGTGAQSVATDLRADLFIDILRNRMAVMGAGAQMLGGLVGDIAIPKQSGAATAYWISENNAPTKTRQTITQVTGTPKTVGAYTELTRKLLRQSSLDVEQMVRNDLAAVLARAIDKAALHGTGDSGQPRGVTETDGVAEVDIASAGSPKFEDLVAFEEAIESENADIGAMRWLASAMVKGRLRRAPLTVTNAGAAVGESRLYQDGEVLGYPFTMTNQVDSTTLLFGVWSELIIGLWGGLDLNTDTSNLVTSGGVQVVALQDVDVMLRYPEAFAFADNVYVPAS